MPASFDGMACRETWLNSTYNVRWSRNMISHCLYLSNAIIIHTKLKMGSCHSSPSSFLKHNFPSYCRGQPPLLVPTPTRSQPSSKKALGQLHDQTLLSRYLLSSPPPPWPKCTFIRYQKMDTAVFWPRKIFGGDGMRVRVGLDGDRQWWKKKRTEHGHI